jgi:hypothetical protein
MANNNVQAMRTIDHEDIKQWIEERGGRPSVVVSTRSNDTGMLHIDFGEGEYDTEQVSWEDFFRIFEEYDLAFIYEESVSDDAIPQTSYAFKFVARGPEDEMTQIVDEGDELADTD